jgi:hypothetical protein
MAVDQFTRAYYELAFRCAFLERKGEAFQDLFSTVMEKRYPGDFIRTRPWGRQGDRKNDGYVRSTRTLFQVYAPNELSEAETLAKIDEDYFGAIPFWQEYFDHWVFVHNSVQGLGPGVERKLLDLDNGHKHVRVRPCGREELRRVTFELGPLELASVLGPIPSRTDLINVQFPEVELVLRSLGRLPIPPAAEVRPVPPRKLETNGLSDGVALLLRAGIMSSYRVGEYFSGHYDPNLGDRVAQAFRQEYESLRNAMMPPDDIFARLQLVGNGTAFVTPTRQAATLTVLAYLFEECDIFERPPEEAGP